MSRLDVSTANLTGFRAADERVRREGIKIKTLEELGVEDERLLHQIHEVESRSAQDIPSTQGISEDPYDEWAQRVLQGEGRPPSCFWIALDGDRPVGIARLTLRPQAAAFNGYTGVDRAYRGRGIAKALKLRTVEWARENGIRYIYTGNDAENHAMLAVNVALGYTPVSRQLEVIKELAHEHPATA
jgi:GNAT superfamily N-acetyltransferase